MTNTTWMASVVFDGSRSIKRIAPDLDLRCARVVRSAEIMGLIPPITADEIERLAWAGIDRFDDTAELYIRPLIYSEEGFVVAVPESIRCILSVFEAPLPAGKGLRVCLSSFRRPSPDTTSADAKTARLYFNVACAQPEARGKSYDSVVMLDA